MRTLLLKASENRWLRERATKTAFVRRSVARFMPGERLDDALVAATDLQTERIGTIFTKLGENVARLDDADAVTEHYLDVLKRVHSAGLEAQIAVKPTQLGLDVHDDLCFNNLQQLVDCADRFGNLVWLDMESSSYVDRTLALYRRMRERSPRIGIALQAYLYRTEEDVKSLLPLGAAIRLVKGAYLEPASIAFPKKADVDHSFYMLACRLLSDDAQRADGLLHIATHDARLVKRVSTLIASRSVPASAYEYAMLYGIQRPLQRELAKAGHRLRILISYGEHWFPWYMRRLAERPANVWFVAKSLVAR